MISTVVSDDVGTYIATEIRRRADLNNHFSLVLAGGKTFQNAYKILAAQPLPWGSMDIFFGDERQVSIGDVRSNYYMAAEELGLVWDRQRVHWSLDAETYNEDIKKYLDRNKRFDITLLGLGPDGHTASLFPGYEEHWDRPDRMAVHAPAGREPLVSRITMTPIALSKSELILVAATGKEKAEIVQEIIVGHQAYPFHAIKPNGKLLLVLDSAAASLL